MAETDKKINPLASFFRQPKIHISLPSKGKFYPDGVLSYTETGEFPVYAMTARDELLFKTPDAMMNGSATVDVIKSCIPSITDPWKMPSIDIDAVLCGIRIATYGHQMDMTSQCPHCGHINDLTIDLRMLLDSFNNIEFKTEIVVNDSIVIRLRPLSYAEITKTNLKVFEHQRIFNIINDQAMSEEDKIKLVQESFAKLTDLTIQSVAQSITSVETSAGSTSEYAFIEEFIRNTDKTVFNEISKTIEASKKSTQSPVLDTTCSECSTPFKVGLTLDQSDFFGKGF
jgi:hypothetical protein